MSVAYTLSFRPGVERDRRRLPKEIQRRFADALERLAESPYRARSGLDIRPLAGGRKGVWRLRVGSYRATYEVVGTTVVVLEMGHRSNFY